MKAYSLTYRVNKKGFKTMLVKGIVIADDQVGAVQEGNRQFELIKEHDDLYEFKLESAKSLNTGFFFIQQLQDKQ
jgi:hypothetical protein